MTVDDKIVKALHEAKEPLGPKEIADRTGEDHGYVRKRVRALDKNEKIQRLSGGKYRTRRENPLNAEVEVLSEGLSPERTGMTSGTETNGAGQGEEGEPEGVRKAAIQDVVEVDGRFLEGLARGEPLSEVLQGAMTMRKELDAGAREWVVARVEGHSGEPIIPSGTWVLGVRSDEVKGEGYHLLSREQASEANSKKERRTYEAGYLYPWPGQKPRGFIEETGPGRDNRTWIHTKGRRYRLKASPRVGAETIIIGAIVGALTNPNAFERFGRPKE